MTAILKKTKPDPSAKVKFVEVALPIPLRNSFTYSVPTDMQTKIAIGSRLIVPFRNRKITGYAVVLHKRLSDELGIERSAVKNVFELLDSSPLLTEEIIELTRWAAGYYSSSWGEMLKASLPAGINATVESILNITDNGREFLNSKANRQTQKIELLDYLNSVGEVSVKRLKRIFGASKTLRLTNELLNLGYATKTQITISAKVKAKKQKAAKLVTGLSKERLENLPPAQSRVITVLRKKSEAQFIKSLAEQANVGTSPINTLEKHGLIEFVLKEVRRDPLTDANSKKPKELKLTDEQSNVLDEIKKPLNDANYQAFLLHGVTGSGKTEVYIRAMTKALAKEKSSLMLVPEIALTPVFSKRLRAVFGDKVAILHSSLSAGERFDEWRRIRKGDAQVVIGTRSAVFAPIQDIGLIIVDEEHDSSYRQHEMPFYNGRDVAIVRAKNADAVIVLGSATPALESYHNSHTGKFKYLRLPNRIGNRPLAKAETIDMRKVFSETGKDQILSAELVSAIEETHARGEQSIILLNRRGFSQFVLCRSCGETIRCTNCDITLTFHRGENKLICHYCNHKVNAPKKCPSCKSEFLYFLGEGTEQIENLLQRKFSNLRIARVDRDTTRKRKQLENILSEFSCGEIDMLVGTQMIAKGHDFPNVTLVGVVSVDAGLSMPDFRSAERTFQLLTQVAGRAGRGELQGKVLIQTHHPENYALRHAKKQDYDSFYREEIVYRERMHYPPFVALASILIKHPNYNYAFDNAQILREALDRSNKSKQCIVLGPAPAPLARLKGEHRLQILVKSKNRTQLRETIDFATADADSSFCDMKIVYVEIDPINLL